MLDRRKKLNEKEEDKILQELICLYRGEGSENFTFEHGNTNQKDSHDFDGHYTFKEYYQVLILLLFYIKNKKPSQNLYKLLDYSSLDKMIGHVEKDVYELKKRFLEETVYPDEFAQYAIADQSAYRELEAKGEELKQQKTNEISAFYSFFYHQTNFVGDKVGVYDFDGITSKGLYDCWCYLKKALKLNKGKKRKDPREYILETIIFAYNKGVASFNTNYNEFFDAITSTYIDKNFSSFLNDFSKKNKIKKVYSSHLESIPGLANTIYTSSLYSGKEEDLEAPLIKTRKKINMFLHKMNAANKKKHGGTIFLKTCLEQKDIDITGEGDHIDYKTFIDNVKGKTHCESLFYYKKYDLAVLHERNFSREEKTIAAKDKRAQRRYYLEPPDTNTILSATTGVKEGGFVFLIINKRNSRYWSMFFRNIFHNHEEEANLSIETIIPLQDHVWLILKKTKQKPNITFFDGKHFTRQMMSTSKGSEIELVLDYKGFIGEFNKTSSPHKTEIKHSDLLISRFNLSAKRWFMPNFPGKKLRSFVTFYPGEPLKNEKKIKLVDMFSYPKKSSGGLDYEKVPWHQITPEQKIKTLRVRKIKKSCLLINLATKGLNAVWFEYKNKPIYINPRTFALEVDQTKILGPYLELMLLEKNISKQLSYFETNELRIGSAFYEIMESLKIKTPPSKLKQKEYIDNKVKEKIKNLLEAANEIKQASGVDFDEYFKGIQSDIDWLDHAIALPINQLNAASLKLKKVLYETIKKEELDSIRKNYSKRYTGKSLDDLFENLLKIGEEIDSFVQYAGNRSRLTEKEEKSLKEIVDILYTYESSNEKRTISVSIKVDSSLLDDKANYGIKINEPTFKFMINEVINNASKHGGFTKESPGKITIELSTKSENDTKEIESRDILENLDQGYEEVILSIKNNGKPMPFGKEEFVKKRRRGNSTGIRGKGLGGAEVAKIADSQCLRWDVKQDTPEFVFIFELKLLSKQND